MARAAHSSPRHGGRDAAAVLAVNSACERRDLAVERRLRRATRLRNSRWWQWDWRDWRAKRSRLAEQPRGELVIEEAPAHAEGDRAKRSAVYQCRRVLFRRRRARRAFASVTYDGRERGGSRTRLAELSPRRYRLRIRGGTRALGPRSASLNGSGRRCACVRVSARRERWRAAHTRARSD